MKARDNMKERPFIKKIMKMEHLLRRRMPPREIHIFNINGNYGHYSVEIGPEYSPMELKKMHLKPHTRPLKIDGEIHHLFLTRNKISPTPLHEEVDHNLKGTVIMKDLMIHLYDMDGKGLTIKIERMDQDGVHAKDYINLAGEMGEKMLHEYESTGRITKETYRIVQEDILRSLEGHAKLRR